MYADSFGYRFRGSDGVLYHDIMSYDPGHTIPYFSNHHVRYKGVPTGRSGYANAAATINATAPIVENYRRNTQPYGAATRISVSTGDATVMLDEPVTLTANVTCVAGAAYTPDTGSVVFLDGDTILGVEQICDTGTAIWSGTLADSDIHHIRAMFQSEGWLGDSTSAVLTMNPPRMTVRETARAGTAVGNVPRAADVSDAGMIFSITDGNQDGVFAINARTGGISVADPSRLDYETKRQFCLTVQATDPEGDFDYCMRVRVNVKDIAESPTDLRLSRTTVAENRAAGAVVGKLLATDPDASERFTFALVAGEDSTDNCKFQVIGDTLRTRAPFDFEKRGSYAIRLRVTDKDGLTYEKEFTIAVQDVAEALGSRRTV